MFYFGGMTLGYLTPPAPKAGGKEGKTMAESRLDAPSAPMDEAAPDNQGLLARAKWFGLYW